MTTASGTIYVIDDDPLILGSLGGLLELETPHRVRRFSSGHEALAAMQGEAPDLVVSDIAMPGIDGLELMRRTRAVCPDAARVVLTGYADKESAIRAINDGGVYQFVEKPWDNAQLLAVVASALEHVALERRLRETVAALSQRNVELERTITELREAQERLVAAERLAAVGRLASGVAHEIGNQLSLLSYAELLAERYAHDPEATELTEPLLAAKQRLGAMVGTIRDFVRRGDGSEYARTPQELAPILDKSLAILRFEQALKTRRIEREPDDRATRASVNRDQVIQVLLNLIRNAMHATRAGGRIRLGVSTRDGRAVIEVADDGAGIAAAHLDQIWEPFFSTKGDLGTGLGLGMCRRIVQEHGGTISVESAPGAGAKFTIELPVVQ